MVIKYITGDSLVTVGLNYLYNTYNTKPIKEKKQIY